MALKLMNAQPGDELDMVLCAPEHYFIKKITLKIRSKEELTLGADHPVQSVTVLFDPFKIEDVTTVDRLTIEAKRTSDDAGNTQYSDVVVFYNNGKKRGNVKVDFLVEYYNPKYPAAFSTLSDFDSFLKEQKEAQAMKRASINELEEEKVKLQAQILEIDQRIQVTKQNQREEHSSCQKKMRMEFEAL
jgi:hypothetical protein